MISGYAENFLFLAAGYSDNKLDLAGAIAPAQRLQAEFDAQNFFFGFKSASTETHITELSFITYDPVCRVEVLARQTAVEPEEADSGEAVLPETAEGACENPTRILGDATVGMTDAFVAQLGGAIVDDSASFDLLDGRRPARINACYTSSAILFL